MVISIDWFLWRKFTNYFITMKAIGMGASFNPLQEQHWMAAGADLMQTMQVGVNPTLIGIAPFLCL